MIDFPMRSLGANKVSHTFQHLLRPVRLLKSLCVAFLEGKIHRGMRFPSLPIIAIYLSFPSSSIAGLRGSKG